MKSKPQGSDPAAAVRMERMRERKRAYGMVPLYLWCHSDDADAVREYVRRKNKERGL